MGTVPQHTKLIVLQSLYSIIQGNRTVHFRDSPRLVGSLLLFAKFCTPLCRGVQHFCFAKATLRVSDKSFGAILRSPVGDHRSPLHLRWCKIKHFHLLPNPPNPHNPAIFLPLVGQQRSQKNIPVKISDKSINLRL